MRGSCFRYDQNVPLDPDIAMLVIEIDANLSHAESITHGLTREQFQWRPEPGRWSIGECFAHLNVTNGYALGAIETGIAKGRGKKGQGPFQYGIVVRKFIASQEPPAKKKFKAPKVFLPPADTDPDATLAEYRRNSAELKRLTREADGLHLARVKIEMPALPAVLRAFVRMPLGGQLLLTTTHDRRHLWQAEQVRNDPKFPSGPQS
jgi:DinB superfamily